MSATLMSLNFRMHALAMESRSYHNADPRLDLEFHSKKGAEEGAK